MCILFIHWHCINVIVIVGSKISFQIWIGTKLQSKWTSFNSEAMKVSWGVGGWGGGVSIRSGRRRETEGNEFILLCLLYFDPFRSVWLFWPLRGERNGGPFQISRETLEPAISFAVPDLLIQSVVVLKNLTPCSQLHHIAYDFPPRC